MDAARDCQKRHYSKREISEKHHAKIPRTRLRYAIEKYPERKRPSYLKKIIVKHA
jgi:hypothetical protein